jgi:5'-nucleotidase
LNQWDLPIFATIAKKMKKDRLILVTNDDGVHAGGIKALIEAVQPYGKVVVVAPHEGQSGMSHAITVKVPLRIEKLEDHQDRQIYACNGTPVDCVKLALDQLLDRAPDLIVSGINHGANSSTAVVYSGTMAAAIEGCLNQVPSIGFSLLDFSRNADFSTAVKFVPGIVERVLEEGLAPWTCLNVNIPMNGPNPIRGIKVCRQTKGMWKEEFDRRRDPAANDYFWLTGEFKNMEPEATDTDEWALKHGYVSIVPVNIDLTDYELLQRMKSWEIQF